MAVRHFSLVCCWWVVFLPAVFLPATPLSAAEPAAKHALLIGCTDYPRLDDFFQLEGPVNDVALMRQVLIESYGFTAESGRMVTLAASEDAMHQPTRANIQREFESLARRVQAGDEVLILMGGHGSQQPDNDPENPMDAEPDGLDEVFLPCDVGPWDGKAGMIENAIVDDQLRQWLSALVAKQASVCIIMDACHSGSGVRGSDAERSRQVPPGQLVPKALLDSVRESSSEDDASDSLFDGPGDLVAIYAAQPHETTPEKKLPLTADPDARKYYGLLSFTLCDLLSNTNRKLTYNELIQEVQSRYVAMGRRSPTPLIEGSNRDRIVMGKESFPERSRIRLSIQSDDEGTINSGALQGVTKGSIYRITAPLDDAGRSNKDTSGFVQVTEVDMTSATVVPVAYDESPKVSLADVQQRSVCELVFRDLGDRRLGVAVDSFDDSGTAIAESLHQRLTQLASELDSELVEVVTDPQDAQWLIRYNEGEVRLVPGAGIATGDESSVFVSHGVRSDWPELMREDLRRIARATNLLRLTGDNAETDRGGLIGLSIKTFDEENNEIQWQSAGRVLKEGQQIKVRLQHFGRENVDVTLLYVDNAYGITCLYPNPGESNRLRTGDSQSIRLRINAETVGLESLVAIVVKSDGQPVDYSVLEQPSLERASAELSRDVNRGGVGLFETPLGRLCKTSLYGVGASRGVTREAEQNYRVSVMSWKIEP
ncbi:caspase family protein [Stieleria varia]|uniref:Caspase domain protein n=1 Tax=Stieleria varia TaxID=2528005 RepID=A0A5C6A3Q7_9BACT|nr:caspase family protein [Stieleria varia]TWT93841.1 Caspase domain protein [Stieleria varia]